MPISISQKLRKGLTRADGARFRIGLKMVEYEALALDQHRREFADVLMVCIDANRLVRKRGSPDDVIEIPQLAAASQTDRLER